MYIDNYGRIMPGDPNELYHHGVKGMHWGERNGPPYPIGSNLRNRIPYKVDEIKNYKGKLYFLSETDMNGKTIKPRVPKNYFTDNDFEDNQTPRVCFAPSVDQCLMGLSQNLKGKTYVVYEPSERPSSVHKPNAGAVPDSSVTGELWVKEPVTLKEVGRIHVIGDDGKDGKKFSYGLDREAELYGWNYKWTSENTSSSLADDIFRKASKKEPKISSDVKNAARVSGSKMHGLEHRLKTKESIQRKIETDSLEKEISSDKAAKDLKDAVRYTTITNDNQFVSSYNKFKRSMEARGYEEVRCKNYFDLYKRGKVKHKSVQSVFRDRDGYLFEVQFQTPASQRAKDLKVPIYEERRKPGLSESRQKELEKQMVDLAENVPYPKGIDSIKSHDAPKKSSSTASVTSRVKALRSSGNSYAEIAKKLGISESSVGYYLNL